MTRLLLPSASEPPTLAYQPALDGLRAVAVLLVVGFHARLPGFDRGDLGVDVFFVLSGFLITSLIVAERVATGAFWFRRFYLRRLVRLFPAYALVLVACLIAAAARGYGGTARGAVLSLLYVANWGAAQGQGLGLLRHTWSLSIEEQFYLIWPVVLVLLIGLFRGRIAALTLVIVAMMAVSYGSALALVDVTSLTWVANATPTRAGMLLAGAVLAVGLRQVAATSPALGRSALATVAGCLGLAAVIGVATVPALGSADLIGSVWPVVAVGTAVTIAATVLAPQALPARLLGAAPLVAIGKRSYGIYLWHFPVFVVLDTEFDGLTGGQVLAATALSLLLAAASYRFVEQPLIGYFRGRTGLRPVPGSRPEQMSIRCG